MVGVQTADFIHFLGGFKIALNHRIRIKTDEKAKVLAPVWGTELIKFLVTLSTFHQDDLKKKDD